MAQPHEADNQQTGRDEQRDADRRLRRHERSTHHAAAPALGRGVAIGSERVGWLRGRVAHCGERADEEPGRERAADRERKHPRVERRRIQQRKRRGRDRLDDPRQHERDRGSERPAANGEEDALDQRFGDQLAPPGAERRPDRGVAPPARVARKQQVRQVHADDQQDGRRRGEQHEQRSSRVPDDHRLQRLHDGSLAPLVLRLFRDRRLERVQLGPQRVRLRAGAHARDHAVVEIAGRSQLVGAECGRTEHVDRLRQPDKIAQLLRAWNRRSRRQHADDRHGCAVERDRAPDDGRVAPELADPQRAADHGDAMAARTIVRVRERPTRRRTDAEHGKECRGYACRVELLGFTAAGQRRRARVDRRHRLAGCASFAPRLHVSCVDRERRIGALKGGIAEPQRYEAIRGRVWQRPQQHGVHDREKGRVGADPEREHHQGDRRDGAIAPQTSERVADQRERHTDLDVRTVTLLADGGNRLRGLLSFQDK